MRSLQLLFISAITFPALASGGDSHCPRYPQSQRTAWNQAIELERLAAPDLAKPRTARRAASSIPRANLIDPYVLDRLDAAQVDPAPLSADAEFLRRVSIDLTGRPPSLARTVRFLEDSTAGKRARLIEDLIESPAFVDQWTQYFAQKFEVTSGYYSYVGIDGRNKFFAFLKDFVARDRSYKEVVTEMLTASGDSATNGPANFLVRAWQDGDPLQDTWDTAADRVTTRLLGVKTECISCHDGRRHLEQINLHLTSRKRSEFWGLAAFFSRTYYQRLNSDGFGQRASFFIADRRTPGYSADVNPANPGPRPSRWGGPHAPVYPFGGQKPASENWRAELARIITNDPQFARATVNYVWAALFNSGIVDPPDAWDLARVDPKNPPPGDWPLQVSHPDLLDHLSEYFVNSNYSIRHLVRLIVNSSSYQLSSRYSGDWKPQYARLFAKHEPRRLSPEEMWDSLSTATGTETPMTVYGWSEPVWYANQLPDPTEPRSNFNVRNFLTLFGRGDWWRIATSPTPSILQLLYTMNDSQVVLRTFASRADAPPNTVARISASAAPDEEAIAALFLATLTRPPSADEMKAALASRRGSRAEWLADLQWVLINKLDFIFNY